MHDDGLYTIYREKDVNDIIYEILCSNRKDGYENKYCRKKLVIQYYLKRAKILNGI